MGLFGFGNNKKKAEEREAEEQAKRAKEQHDELVASQKKDHEGMPWPSVMPINFMKNKDHETLSKAEDPISAERKDEIGNLIYEPSIAADQVKDLSLQELLFLLDTHEIFTRKAPLHDYEKNHRVIYNELLRRLHGVDQFYMLYDKATGYPFLDSGFGLVYMEKEHAEQAAAMYAQQFRNVVALTRPGEEAAPLENGAKPIQLFDYLYYVGIENIIVDNGWYKGIIKRSEISAPPTWNSDASKIPPAAPALQYAMIDFTGEARWNVKYDKRDEVLKRKMDRINALIPKQKYVIPMQVLDKTSGSPAIAEGVDPASVDPNNKQIKFPMLKLKAKKVDGSEEEQVFLPVFTDLFEYSKSFAKSEFRPIVFPYDKVLTIIQPMHGLVINPRGESIVVPKVKALELGGVKPTPTQAAAPEVTPAAASEAPAVAPEAPTAAPEGEK